MTLGPGHRKRTAYLWPGPGGTPLALPLTDGLGLARGGLLPRVALIDYSEDFPVAGFDV